MTESELLTRNPQQTNIHAPHQQQQQQHSHHQQQQPSTNLLLLNQNIRLDSRPETLAVSNLINSLETNYHNIVERFGNLSLNETIDFLMNNIIDPKEAKHLIEGFFCGVLVDTQNAEKHFTCLKTIARGSDQWMGILTSFNMLTLEVYPYMKHSCKQQLFYFIDEALKLSNRTLLDSAITNLCRALSDGTDFRETCQTVHQFASRLLSSHQKFLIFPKSSTFPPTAFALFSRFISDAQLVANAGIMNLETFKAPLIEICVILVRERFADLLQIGHDLFLLFMRLSKVSQFVPIWRTLLHNPSALAPKMTGLQQLLTIPTSNSLLTPRVSLRISRKISDIFKYHTRTIQTNTTPQVARQMQIDINKQFDALKSMHLSGPDSFSIRAEIIRHVWAFVEPKDFNPQTNEARAILLGWLLRTAKPGAELQWCKLAFFWEWFCFDPSSPNSYLAAEPILTTIRHLLNTGHTPLGNSLVDFLIKATSALYPPLNFFFVNSITAAMKSLETTACLQVQPVFAHSKLDQILRDQFRLTFPDVFPKRLTSIADNLAAPSSIIDFDAIRQTTTNSISCINLINKQQQQHVVSNNLGENIGGPLSGEKNHQIVANGRSGGGVGSNPATTSSSSSTSSQVKSETLEIVDVSTKHNKNICDVSSKNEKTTTRRPPLLSQNVDAPPLKKKMLIDLNDESHNINSKINKEKKKEDKKKEEKIKKNIINDSTISVYQSTTKPSSSQDSLILQIAEDDEEEEEIEIKNKVKEEENNFLEKVEQNEEEIEEINQQSTSKKLPLNSLLPMVREEFREHLESLYKAVKKKQLIQNSSDDEAITSMQNLMDSIFDANEMECDQTEYIALCLLRILENYLEQKQSYLPCEDPSDDELTELMEQPLYRLFKTLCSSGEETDTRRFLLGTLRKMFEECKRIGYLFLFFLSSIERENNNRLSRCNNNGWPSVEQAVETYKNICTTMDVEWEKQLAKDLELSSFDDYQLFSHILVNILCRLTPQGPPTKIMRLICGSMSPRLLSRLMSEIVRENVVLFNEVNVLGMLIDSLKWDSIEQIMLWQMLQTEAVGFDNFIDLLQRLTYNQHPEATAAVIVIMRNMEPNPDISVMRNLIRNLLLRPPNKDLFTCDAIKLLIDYEENIPPVATCISKLVKKAISIGDINSPINNSPGGGSSSFSSSNKLKNKVLTAENIFGHLDRLRKFCMEKDSQHTEVLLKNQLILDLAILLKKNPKTTELRLKFDELFALFDILVEDEQATNVHGGGKQQRRNKANNNNIIKKKFRDGTPTKRKRKALREESSESEDD